MRRDWLTLAGMGYVLLVLAAAAVGPGVQGWRELLAGHRDWWVFTAA